MLPIMDEVNELIEQRKKKLDELKSMGLDPYAESFDKRNNISGLTDKFNKTTSEELKQITSVYSISGRIIALRNFGKAVFAHIQDSTDKIQLYFRKDILNEKFKLVKKLDIGDIIGLSGKIFRTKTNELTLDVNDFRLLSKSLRPLPEKWHGLKNIEIRYRQRYVDLIVNPDVKKTFELRSKIIKAMRDFLEDHDFIEVETPMMHPIPGGAAARPFKTHHLALGIDLYLRIAPELYLKRLLVAGYEKIYEMNKNFRNEGISTKHNPEFSMLEFYIAYKDYNFLMSFTEEFISNVAQKTLGTYLIQFGDMEIDLKPPWQRITFIDALKSKDVPDQIINKPEFAFKWAREKGIDIETSVSHGKVLDEIFKIIVEPALIQPTFIMDYPVELSPLAKRKKSNPKLVERFELFVASREIANAFSELNDPVDQRKRLELQTEVKEKGDEEAHWMDEDFLRALEYGMPPAAGEGIGIDRLVMLLTNSQSIRDVILFPQLKPEK